MGSALLKLFVTAALFYQVYSQLECLQCPLICGLEFQCANLPAPNSDKQYCICTSDNNCPVLQDVPVITCSRNVNVNITCESPKIPIQCKVLSTNLQVVGCCNYENP